MTSDAVTPFVAYTRASNLVREGQRDWALVQLQMGADSLGAEILAIQERSDTSPAFVKRLDSLRVRTDSTKRELISLLEEQTAIAEVVSWVRPVYYGGIGLIILGAAMAIWGFRQWYVKLQKPLDTLIQAEIDEKRHRASTWK